MGWGQDVTFKIRSSPSPQVEIKVNAPATSSTYLLLRHPLTASPTFSIPLPKIKQNQVYRIRETLGRWQILGMIHSHFIDQTVAALHQYQYCLIPVIQSANSITYQPQKAIRFTAQTESIFPGLYGQQLLDSLVATYKPATVLNYDDARDTLFAKIDNHNDSLRGVYSGYTIYLNPNADPSTDAYTKGINTEHTWPQSKGADTGNAKSDMHHLYPVRDVVNSSRSNDPYAEVNDNDTDKWWRKDYYLTTIPTQYIDEYSEKDQDANQFEPREDHKGNAARSVFYFYTMYKDQADSVFFAIQKDVLYQWHQQDPADQAEIDRTWAIAAYQDNKPNPFVLDSSLVRRAYFTNTDTTPAPPTNVTFSNVTDTSMTISWSLPTDYNATINDIVVLMQASSAVDDDPTPNAVSSYSASPIFGQGSQVGSGSYVVYIGDDTTVTVTGLQAATTYYVKLWNTENDTIWSNRTASGSQQTTGGGGNTILITEIMKNPNAVADSDGEWFEIYNYGTADVNINGWTIKDLGTDQHTIDNGGPLWVPAKGFLVLGISDNSATNGGVSVDYVYSSIYLGNADDELILIAADGTTEVDRVTWDDGINWPDPTGASMVFTGESFQDNNDPSLWTTATQPWPGSAGDLGSPGYAGSDQALPVVLSAFQLQWDGATVILSWQTESETNNEGFEIYRSLGDSLHYRLRASYTTYPQLAGQGSSATRKAYQFLDNEILPDTQYWYKLASVDLNGKRYFYPAKQITLSTRNIPGTFQLLAPFPNPFNGRILIPVGIPTVPEPVKVSVTIFDIHGRRVATLADNLPLSSGFHTFIWEGKTHRGNSTAAGIYFVVLSINSDLRLSRKIIYLK